ncbi:hypothetical protein FRB97_003984, partial [Tulasnella sp. 331]
LEKAITESGMGLIIDSMPQREVLAYPSLGSFLTPCLRESLPAFSVCIGEAVQPPTRGGKVEGTPAAIAAEFKLILSEMRGE